MCNETTRRLEAQVSDLDNELRLAKPKINEIITAISYGSGQPIPYKFESVARKNKIKQFDD